MDHAGLSSIAPVVAMFVFAILFFGVMTDAGLFDRIVAGVRRVVGTRPAWIVPGTALLAALVHLDGSGAVTFLVVVPAMLPLYEALGMDPRLPGLRRSDGRGRHERGALGRADENLLVSSATGEGGLSAEDIGASASIPLHAGARDQVNVGLQQALGRRVVLDADYFWKKTNERGRSLPAAPRMSATPGL